MNIRRLRIGRSVASAAIAIALALTLSTQAVAATWNDPVSIGGTGDAFFGDLATVGTATAVAVYQETVRRADGAFVSTVFARRSTDAGETWNESVPVGDGLWPAVAARGPNVDVAWQRAPGIQYAVSADGGASFSPFISLSPAGEAADVARGNNGLVAVTWLESGGVQLRVSSDGGASFAAAKTIAPAVEGSPVAHASVAIGKGVMYVAYKRGSLVRLMRSVDSGESWSGEIKISDHAVGAAIDQGFRLRPVNVTAAGEHAYVAYTAPNTLPGETKVRYRRTRDKGATWSRRRDLAPSAWNTENAQIALRGGTVRAVFDRCAPEPESCQVSEVFYTESVDGRTWNVPEQVSPSGLVFALAQGVGFAGNAFVAYRGWSFADNHFHAYVRTGSP